MGYTNIMDTGALWWEEIAGPSSMILNIQSALAEGHSVICNVTTALSYRWVFRDSIGHWLADRGVMVVHIDCNGEYSGGDITQFLLRRIQPDMVTEYQRRRSPQFLHDKGVLHGKMLWIRGVEPKYLREWIQYISSYRSHDLEHGLLFMELQEEPPMRLPQNLRFFDYNQYVRKDDLRLYASVMAENYLKESIAVKQYAVELAAALCVTDGEVVNELLLHPDFVYRDPVEVLRQVVSDNYQDSPRGRGEGHLFSLLANDREDDLRYRIWSAQIRVGYPRIELERQELIRQWYEEIQEALSKQYFNERTMRPEYFLDYEGNRITDPFDVEVGMLQRMMSLRRHEDTSQYMLYIPDADVRDRIRLLRDCRNELAHLNCCVPDQFCKLLSGE